jgi:transporter family-2 protein
VILQSASPRYLIAVAASVIAGLLIAIQTRVNGELGIALDQGVLAALFSFGSGLVIVATVTVFNSRARRGVSVVIRALRDRSVPWWAVLGGAIGAFLVLSQGVSAGVLGVALFSIAVVTGQALGAVAIDTRGWFGSARIPLTLWRVLGAVTVLVGVVIAVDVPSGDSREGSLLFLLHLVAGLGSGYQQAVNGRVRELAGSPASATLINFIVGTSTLVIALLVSLPVVGLPESLPATWWLWSGGAIGTVLIAIQVSTVSIIGVLGLGVSIVTGQLVGSILLDIFAPVGSSSVHAETILGAVITLVGALAVTLSRRSV